MEENKNEPAYEPLRRTITEDFSAPFDEDTSVRFCVDALQSLRIPEPTESFIVGEIPAASNAARYHVLKGVEIELKRLMDANAMAGMTIEEK